MIDTKTQINHKEIASRARPKIPQQIKMLVTAETHFSTKCGQDNLDISD